ncbi:hypothetical protein DL93DRAFT_2164904 [Clavulina sp. PMI_390]|nr:hypothetical protein DL93DRAFT_2164904 [Clavulina sp. PMI_390]
MSYDAKAMKQDLSAWMAEAARRVEVEARYLERDIVQPLWTRYTTYAQTNPATTAFLTTFTLMALLPVIIFSAFATFVISSLTLAAMSTVAFFCFWIVGGALGILLFTLSIVALISVGAALGVFAALIAFQLVVHLTNSPTNDGFADPGLTQKVKNWFSETKSRFGLPSRPVAPQQPEVLKGKVVY